MSAATAVRKSTDARVLGTRIAVAVLTLAVAWCVYDVTGASPPPTAESYVSAKPGRVLAGDGFAIGKTPVRCGKAQVVLDPGLDDLAAAYPGIIILNSKYLPRLPEVVTLYAFGHECGHQLHGRDEALADCYAVMRGRGQGWLDASGIDRICEFWKPFAGDNAHLPGVDRCALMRRCFAAASP